MKKVEIKYYTFNNGEFNAHCTKCFVNGNLVYRVECCERDNPLDHQRADCCFDYEDYVVILLRALDVEPVTDNVEVKSLSEWNKIIE